MVEVFTYGNGTMLIALFQAVAALTSTADYMELIRIVFVMSTLVVMIEIVWTGRFKATARLFTIILMMNVAILTTADVNVTDQVNPANSGLVADVPAGLAAPLALTTAIGNWATGAFETVFSMPNDLRYQTNGLLFSSRLLENTTQFEITDARMARNMAEFAQGCIYYGVMADWFSLDTVMESGDIWAALPATSFGNAIFVEYDDGGGTNLWGCKDVRTFLEADWANAIDEMASVYGQRIFSQDIESVAKTKLLSVTPQAYTYMSTISTTAAKIIQQNAMINTMRRSFTNLANDAGALGAAQDFALAQAEAQQRTTYATLGAMAGRMMSLFSNVLETLIYGIFPIAFIFTLIALMQGKAILMYFKLLFWLQLWPPMFAILNFAMSVYAAESTTAAAMQAGGGPAVLNMLTYTGMTAVNSDMSAMAGYLSWIIPMFSWAIVSGSGFAAAQMAASLGSVAQSSGSSAAGAVSSGNLSLGNMSSGNHSYGNSQLKNYSGFNTSASQDKSSPTMDAGRGSYVNPTTGTMSNTSAGGFQTHNVPQNSMPIKANLASSLKSTVGSSLAASQQAVKTASDGLSATTQSTYSNMQKLAQMSSSNQSTGSGSDYGSSGSFSNDFGKMDKLVSQFAHDNNMSKGQAASMLVAASMSTDKSALGSMAGLATGMSARGGLDYKGSSTSSEKWSAAQQFAEDNNFSEKWSAATKSGESTSQNLSQQRGDSQSKDMAGGFTDQKAASRQLQSSMTEAQAWQSLSSRLSESGAGGGSDAVGAFLQYAQQPENGGYSLPSMMNKMAAMTSTSGDAAGATNEMNGLVSGFVQSQAGEMAGVSKSFTPESVQNANQANQNEVSLATGDESFRATGSGNIKADGGGNSESVRQMAESNGVPSAETVNNTANAVQAESSNRREGVNNTVSAGGDGVSTQGSSIEQAAMSNSAPDNQNHVVNATAQMANAGMDSIGDIIDTGKAILGGGMTPSANSQSSPAQSGSITGGSSDDGQGQFDLPPTAAESGSEETPKNPGVWANRLD
jgi:conjugal transfer mating pair stabilization protein TraG